MSKFLTKFISFGNKTLHLLKKYWYVVLIIIGLAGYYFYSQYSKERAIKYSSHTVKRQTLKETLSFSGQIKARESVQLHFQTGGRVAWIGVKVGDTVNKYQGIAALDARDVQKRIEKYLNTYSKTRNSFDQSVEDNEEVILDLSQEVRERAKRTVQSSQFDLNNSVLDVELQAIAKEYSYLYTPIEGIVTRADVLSSGANITIADTYEVINPKSIYFAVSADQTEVVNLKSGMSGKVTFDSYPNKGIDATITSISFTPKRDESGTVYEVEMSMSSDVSNYRLGMTGDVEFVIREVPNNISIPFDYLTQEGDLYFVLKDVSGKKVKTEVKIGDEFDGAVVIDDGLFAGDVIYVVTK